MTEKIKAWKKLSTIAEISTKWVTIHVDEMLDSEGNKLEYWYYERSDSAIVIVRQGDNFILPKPSYRPGINAATLDFVGGRIPENMTPDQAARMLIEKELKLDKSVVKDMSLQPINKTPWFVDSSFSSQKLWGFVAEIPLDIRLQVTQRFTISQLFNELHCLQCRALLLALSQIKPI